MLFWLFNRCSRAPGRSSPQAPARLGVCPRCRSRYVVPVDHMAVDEEHWWMRLRCGECGGGREVTVGNDAAQRYDRELAAGMEVIRGVLDRLDRERRVS